MDIKVLISEEEIRQRVQEMGRQIASDYRGTRPILVAVLKGSFIFLADLVRTLDIPHEIDFIAVSSYQGKKSSGIVKIQKDLHRSIEHQHIILVEDIVDTGLTLEYIRKHFMKQRPASLRIATLLHKEVCTQSDIPLDYVGFVIPDQFIVGYGLDMNEKWRNLPYVAVLKES
jgi:hypoxanthine phosphoribosyltransferase